ncbi:60S ribosomal protein L36A [Coccomyxa viridis]|uniref:60S ribosomal protein L36A n=1 Tax=Coccomyxa viridis TaxID=1274662 RepID=A0AAV1ICH2_9CHLO|nr:60S ribosomal protein L36A [Coccomyxa viridis]
MAAQGIAVGLNKGHQVTRKEKVARPAQRKGRCSKRVRFVREIVREVAGLAPYEKRVSELLKVGKDKRALKLCKKKLGTHLRAKRKREEMSVLLRKTKKLEVAGDSCSLMCAEALRAAATIGKRQWDNEESLPAGPGDSFNPECS